MRTRGLVWALVSLCWMSTAGWAAGAWETDAQAYSIRLENAKVRMMDVRFAPGHKIPMHQLRDRLVIILKGGRLRITDESGRSMEWTPQDGEVSWKAAEKVEIENLSPTIFEAQVIEIK